MPHLTRLKIGNPQKAFHFGDQEVTHCGFVAHLALTAQH